MGRKGCMQKELLTLGFYRTVYVLTAVVTITLCLLSPLLAQINKPQQERNSNLKLARGIERGDLKLVYEALGEGANPNLIIQSGEPVLHRAIVYGESMMFPLLAAGARPNAYNSDGHTAAFEITEFTFSNVNARPSWEESKRLLHLLILAGADLSLADKKGRSLSSIPSTKREQAMVREFCQQIRFLRNPKKGF